jgi:hypothetical protein
MNRQVLRIFFLLWLGWYLSGPLFEIVDTWDTPQEEMNDVGWSAGGALSLVAAGVCIGIFLCRKFRELCCYLASVTFAKTMRLVSLEYASLSFAAVPAASPDISPSLRI